MYLAGHKGLSADEALLCVSMQQVAEGRAILRVYFDTCSDDSQAAISCRYLKAA